MKIIIFLVFICLLEIPVLGKSVHKALWDFDWPVSATDLSKYLQSINHTYLNCTLNVECMGCKLKFYNNILIILKVACLRISYGEKENLSNTHFFKK